MTPALDALLIIAKTMGLATRAAQAELERLQAIEQAAKECVAGNEYIKWLGSDGYWCPECGNSKEKGHDEDCKVGALAAALAKKG
jgi:Zn finger protein HypA/HybF involved in hydrogenase expression